MNLRKLILTKNACYIAGRTITPRGIMVHSTGANNPNLKRYVGPDDGLLGVNQNNNHWNQANPDGKQVCVHAFIGKLANGSIAAYQTLPWTHRGWHCGGDGNNTHISFEICEDGLGDAVYFNKVYQEAVELCACLCKLYNLDPAKDGVLICHSEGYKRGIASNHADVMHWFPKHGKSMDTFRAAVKDALTGGGAGISVPETSAVLYRVRKSWSDSKSQKGAFKILDNAKQCADENSGYSVFNEKGNAVYSGSSSYNTYTVKKGDTLWTIAATKLGNGSRYPEIKTLNGLASDTIVTGQILKIPK